MDTRGPSIFREEALEYHASGHRRGDLLRISPAWTQWVFWLLLALLAAGVLYVIFATVPEYAEGVAVIRFEQRTDVVAELPGTVLSIAVGPGDRVCEGDLLVQLGDAQEAAELDRIRRQCELELVNYLRDPSDQSARQTLITLRARKELAEARRQKRDVTALRAGVVSSVGVELGQRLSPGEIMLSLIHPDGLPSVVAMLPGHYRPLLKTGLSLRLEPEGFRYSDTEELTVESVGEVVVGPSEVRRSLDYEIADSVLLQGPLVLVQSKLLSRKFRVGKRSYEYHHGMHARARVHVEPKKRIVFRLVPSLEKVFGNNDG